MSSASICFTEIVNIFLNSIKNYRAERFKKDFKFPFLTWFPAICCLSLLISSLRAWVRSRYFLIFSSISIKTRQKCENNLKCRKVRLKQSKSYSLIFSPLSTLETKNFIHYIHRIPPLSTVKKQKATQLDNIFLYPILALTECSVC